MISLSEIKFMNITQLRLSYFLIFTYSPLFHCRLFAEKLNKNDRKNKAEIIMCQTVSTYNNIFIRAGSHYFLVVSISISSSLLLLLKWYYKNSMLFFFKGDEPGEFWRLLGGRTSTPITVSIQVQWSSNHQDGVKEHEPCTSCTHFH